MISLFYWKFLRQLRTFFGECLKFESFNVSQYWLDTICKKLNICNQWTLGEWIHVLHLLCKYKQIESFKQKNNRLPLKWESFKWRCNFYRTFHLTGGMKYWYIHLQLYLHLKKMNLYLLWSGSLIFWKNMSWVENIKK